MILICIEPGTSPLLTQMLQMLNSVFDSDGLVAVRQAFRS